MSLSINNFPVIDDSELEEFDDIPYFVDEVSCSEVVVNNCVESLHEGMTEPELD